jgi:hypothetical protein
MTLFCSGAGSTILAIFRNDMSAVPPLTSNLAQLSLLTVNSAVFRIFQPGKPRKYRKVLSKVHVVKTDPLHRLTIVSKIGGASYFCPVRPD